MGGTKVSELTELVSAKLSDELYIIDNAGVPAESKNIIAGNFLSLLFGMIYTSGGSGTQVPGLTYSLMNQWASNGLSSAGMTPDSANNKITIVNTGIYFVSSQLSFSGTGSSTINGAVFLNGVEQSHISFSHKLDASGSVNSVSLSGVVDVTSASWGIDLRVLSDGATDDFNLKEGQLFAVRISKT